AGFFAANQGAHVITAQQNPVAVVTGIETHGQLTCQPCQASLVVQRYAALLSVITQHTIKRAAIEKLPTQPLTERARDRSFAGTAGTVDGYDGYLAHFHSPT